MAEIWKKYFQCTNKVKQQISCAEQNLLTCSKHVGAAGPDEAGTIISVHPPPLLQYHHTTRCCFDSNGSSRPSSSPQCTLAVQPRRCKDHHFQLQREAETTGALNKASLTGPLQPASSQLSCWSLKLTEASSPQCKSLLRGQSVQNSVTG